MEPSEVLDVNLTKTGRDKQSMFFFFLKAFH